MVGHVNAITTSEGSDINNFFDSRQIFGTARTQEGVLNMQPQMNSLAGRIAARVTAEAAQVSTSV